MGAEDAVSSSQGQTALGIRVDLLERRDIDIEKQVNAIRDTMATRSDIAAIASQISALNGKIDKRSEIPWQAWGVAATLFIALVGGLYLPINTAVNDLKAGVANVIENRVTTQRYNTDQAREALEWERLASRQARNEDKYMVREDFNVQHADLKTFIAARLEGLQKQIDYNQARLDSVWNARDALTDLRDRLRQLEQNGAPSGNR
jgi:hypothetical protein